VYGHCRPPKQNEKLRNVHVSQFGRHDQSVVTDESLACRADSLFAIGGQWDVGRAGVLAGQRPFGLTVADNEDAGCHFVIFAEVWLIVKYDATTR
jgi:hypothetical protein